jgi:hypothetical protein
MAIIDVIMDELVLCFEDRFEGHKVYMRPLRFTDTNPAIGVYAENWDPDETTMMIGQAEPAASRYNLTIQTMVKGLDEEQARNVHRAQNALMRTVLYRDDSLRLRLLGVSEESEGAVERTTKLGTTGQKFLNSQLQSSFVFMTTTSLYVESEVSWI